MLAALVEKLVALGREKAQTLEIGNTIFTTAPVYEVPARPLPKPLKVHSLRGVAGLCERIADPEKILVVHPTEVQVCGQLEDRGRGRPVYGSATAIGDVFPFKVFLDLETFVIQAQALICDDLERPRLLSIVGNLRDEQVRTVADDGISQEVTLRANVVQGATAVVKNPFTLRPYRTFREVPQPASTFILRVAKGASGMQAALFESDGSAWQIDAVAAIRHELVALGVSNDSIIL